LFEEGEYQEIDITFVTRGIDMLRKALTPFSSKPIADKRSIYGLDSFNGQLLLCTPRGIRTERLRRNLAYLVIV
jgi:hypothetical protein